VLNSADFGVPQHRERIIIVGHLRGTRRPEVFPIEASSAEAVKQIVSGSQAARVYDTDGLAASQKALGGGQGGKTGLYQIASAIRRLTPKECERLQGFPDDWTRDGVDDDNHVIAVSDTQRYKMLGNAVTTTVVQAVFERIFESERVGL
jgi:DNA (cytosine-5)-methyltransferase 1